MAFVHSSTSTKPNPLSMPVLLISFLLTSIIILSQVSAVEGDCKEYINDTFVIGVPGKPSFKSFVKKITLPSSEGNETIRYSGFCIEVFEAALRQLGCYGLPKYEEFNGNYDQLVARVANKTYSAAVGDITILAKRWELDVAFTAPFTESGLTLVVPVRPGPEAGIFLKPFTTWMWLATAAVLVYTMFIVWFVERLSKNEEFSGLLSNQLGNALWFTFSSLFLAHRERIHSNYTRIVVVVWLFLALVLTQSYTANLTSMLTVSRLRPKSWSREKVGCDKNAFMEKYIRDELHFKNVIITIKDEDEYLARFKNPYAKAFVNRYCRDFTLIPTTYSFGGFGFVFQKEYSPLGANVSKAILQLSQQGELKRLEKKWLTPSNECSQSQTTTEDVDSLSLEHSETRTDDVDSLDLLSFQSLFLFSVTTSSVCFLLFLGHLLKDYIFCSTQGLFLFLFTTFTTSSVCFLLFLGQLLKDYIYRSPQPVADVNENNEIV